MVSDSIRYILKLSRPRFWLYLGGTYLLGFTSGVGKVDDFLSPIFFLHLFYFLIIANIFLYGVNDYCDEDTDAFNPKKRDKEEALRTTYKKTLKKILISIVLLSIVMMLLQPHPFAVIAFVLFLALSYFYSAPPIRFKSKPFVDFSSNILYILPGIIGYLHASLMIPEWSIVLAATLWAFAMHLFSAIPDIVPDKKAGLRTSAVILGKEKSLLICFCFWLLACFLLLGEERLWPLNVFVFIYPLIPAVLLLRPNSIEISRVYWLYPYINAFLGFVAFIFITRGI